MKKIIIVSHAMEIGGAEKALLGLLEQIDTKKISVDLFLFRHEGELLKYIPNNINLLPAIPEYTVLARPVKDTIKEGHFLLSVARLFGKYKSKSFDRKHKLSKSTTAIEYSHKYIKKFMPKIQPNTEYDLAISFLTPHYFVDEKVKAKKKIAWIHTDYSTIEVDVDSELKMWDKFDKIISISDDVTNSFLKTFPSLKNKICLIENIMPMNIMITQTNEFIVENEMPNIDGYNLLSIGRFSDAKNFDNVPFICGEILKLGVNVKWYIIGFGGDEDLICQKIDEFNMKDDVIILGKKENPYPYIKKCDVYVQPSRYEGKSVAVREAQILQKPVIITNYTTAHSQLEDGVDGVIVTMELKKCAKEIANTLKDKELLEKLSYNCSVRDYTNKSEINKIYNLL